MLWLLRNRARADAQNKDGCTPLHFIALVGGRGKLMDSEVQQVVTALLEHKASLDALRLQDDVTDDACHIICKIYNMIYDGIINIYIYVKCIYYIICIYLIRIIRVVAEARSYAARKPYPCAPRPLLRRKKVRQDPFLQQKIPLEIAAETQYPKHLMYLMAASYQLLGAYKSSRLGSKARNKKLFGVGLQGLMTFQRENT